MLGRVKRWVLAMLAHAARGSVPALRALLTRPARGDLRSVSGRRASNLSPRRLRRGSNKGPVCRTCVDERSDITCPATPQGEARKGQNDMRRTPRAAKKQYAPCTGFCGDFR
jgi:hypothetical protein